MSPIGLRLRAAPLALVVCAIAGCGGGGGGGEPASFVGSGGDTAVHLTWVRSAKSLRGQLTRAELPARSDATVHTDRIGFMGSIDGTSVSLKLARGFGARRTLDGTLSGLALILDYPGATGSVSTIRLQRGNTGAFERVVASLRGRAAARQRADAALSAPPALVASVKSAMAAMARAAKDPAAAGPGLRERLKAVKAAYATVASDASYDYGDTICDDSGILDADVKALLGSANVGAPVAAATAELQRRFARLAAVPAAQLPADAPTRAEVDAAIAATQRAAAADRSSRTADAHQIVARASELQRKGDAACRKLGGG